MSTPPEYGETSHGVGQYMGVGGERKKIAMVEENTESEMVSCLCT